ncbi:hypothetical protein Psyc_1005 [Psychrobacter arcticus 273-4]|uniref:Head decoration protein n=1 Tax=Psychrobacter arcticus (strain DSM 17307 / VKM B-2377 / 273-4) TaxID=259536 RepID=Q4FT00_PSYA2|nr:hypothetical protein [Psychrobacter arcticus]AAZ18858.1 hypothetical protein Psyc_1005 [Psychrobacter arcticus 273-4]
MNYNYTTEQPLAVDVAPITDSVVPTTATAYSRGDLLVITAGTNVATHSDIATGAQADWHVICLADVTAAEATAKIAAGVEMPVYVAGKFDVAEVKLSGVALTAAQKLAARAYANRSTKITLSVVK